METCCRLRGLASLIRFIGWVIPIETRTLPYLSVKMADLTGGNIIRWKNPRLPILE
jgi:hypothetical protein